MRTRPIVLVIGSLLVATACASGSAATSPAPTTVSTPIALDDADRVDTTTAATVPSTAPPTSRAPSTSSSTTTSTSTSTTTPTTTTPISTTTSSTSTTTVAVAPLPDPWWPATNLAFDALARRAPAVTLSVVRDGQGVLTRASGTTIAGTPATSDSPMVVASVSKLLTALMIARLDQAGSIDVDLPVPWADVAAPVHPAWADVTPRELLNHTSGMPVVRPEWFDGDIDCATFLPYLLVQPPTATRGRWTYSNGNYCALGLLVEHASTLPLDQAVRSILFDPLGFSGVHLTTDGHQPPDVPYGPGLARLSRLGGAGAFIVSTDDIAAALASVTPTDLETLTWPGIIVDQYGWGHTGSVDGAAACAWVLEGGRTVVAATVAGSSPATGGALCDQVVPAVAGDLGIGQGRPDRSPP